MAPTESNEPAFLRRLRGEFGGGDSSRHERPLARPRKQQKSDSVNDDAPTYVDAENHNVLSKEEYEALISQDDAASKQMAESSLSTADDHDTQKETLKPTSTEPAVAIGGSKKKRRAKVLQDDETNAQGFQDDDGTKSAKSIKPRMKSKKVKLSFDDVDN